MPDTADVKLLADQVRIEGRRQVIVDALDLCVDNSDRRSEHTSPDRRALVHDYGDKLTINYTQDYPGGVTIDGLHEINAVPKKATGLGLTFDHLRVKGNTKIEGHLKASNLYIDGNVAITAKKIIFKGEDNAPELEIDGNLRFSDSVVLSDKTKVTKVVQQGRPPVPLAMTYNLFDEISRLRGEVEALKKEVEALKNKIGI
jgi:hypothetical protein